MTLLTVRTDIEISIMVDAAVLHQVVIHEYSFEGLIVIPLDLLSVAFHFVFGVKHSNLEVFVIQTSSKAF
jgi:predicted Zn-dependent protease